MADDCTHESQLFGLCTICGSDVQGIKGLDLSLQKSGTKQVLPTRQILTTAQEAERIDQGHFERMITHRRLVLLLDLDATLLETTNNAQAKEVYEFSQSSHKDVYLYSQRRSRGSYNHYVKMRPGALKFIEDMSKLYDLYIYTAGNKDYALGIGKMLDPKNQIFGQCRIISCQDFEKKGSSDKRKYVEKVFPHPDMVLVLDDRPDVWTGYQENVLQVEPYQFWRDPPPQLLIQIEQNGDGKRRRVGERGEGEGDGGVGAADPLYGPKWLYSMDTDFVLDHRASILQAVHTNFFASVEAHGWKNVSAPRILSALRRRVLDGCVIAFSGVYPKEVNPNTTSDWKIATFFGARCVEDYSTEVTHLIAARPRSEKCRRALHDDKHVVTRLWLYESIKAWEKRDEKDFPLSENEVENRTRKGDAVVHRPPSLHVTALRIIDCEIRELDQEVFSVEDQTQIQVEQELPDEQERPDDLDQPDVSRSSSMDSLLDEMAD